jgi:hypothetical protein
LGPIEILIIVLLWIAPSIAVAAYAKRRGLDFWLCLVLALLISWLVALLIAQVKGQPPQPADDAEDRGEAGRPLDPAPHSATGTESSPTATTKTCPDCAESVQAAARVCRYCGYRFEGTAELADGSSDSDPNVGIA